MERTHYPTPHGGHGPDADPCSDPDPAAPPVLDQDPSPPSCPRPHTRASFHHRRVLQQAVGVLQECGGALAAAAAAAVALTLDHSPSAA